MATLTIDVDDEVLRRATDVAAARGSTLEAAVQRLLRVMAMPSPRRDELPPAIAPAYGMLPPMTDEEVGRALGERRDRKYSAT